MADRRNIFRDPDSDPTQSIEEAILRRESATLLSFDEAQGEDHVSAGMAYATAADWPAWTDDFYYTASDASLALQNCPEEAP